MNSDDQEPENGSTKNGSLIRSIKVSYRLLDAMVGAGEPVRITDIARLLDESKAKVHRHLSTLKSLGVVEQERTSGKYRLGWKLFQLGQAAFEQFDLKTIAEPYMAKLRDHTNQSVVLAVATGGEAMVIGGMDSNTTSSLRISSVPGSITPATASAMGRIVLAFSSGDIRSELMRPPLKRYNANTVTDVEVVRKRLEEIRSRLYEVSNEEVVLGISMVSAPIFDGEENLIGAVGIIGSVQDFPSPSDKKQIAQVQNCAASISAQFNSSRYEDVVDGW